MRRIFYLLTILFLTTCKEDSIGPNEPPSHPGKLYQYQVLPQETEQGIASSNEPHFAYVDTRANSRGMLLIFLSGTNSYPVNYQLFSETAAAEGYHVINLNYINHEPALDCFAKDGECFSQYHEEVLFGTPVSDLVSIDSANSIYNRILATLNYLTSKYPDQKWHQFYTSSSLNFEKLVLAGHSQGGGHAAYFAKKFSINRLILFAAPYDYSEEHDRPAAWFDSGFNTSSERFFGLLHKNDELVSTSHLHAIWQEMGLLSASDTTSADTATFPKVQALVTSYDPNPNAAPRLKHNVPVRDDALPEGAEGEHLKSVWKYLLGD